MFFYNCTTFFYIFSYNITTEWNNSRVTYNTILEDCNISCSTTDINQNYACFFFIFTKYCFCRSYWLKDEVYHLQVGFFNTFINIFCSSCLPDDYVKIGFKVVAQHTNWLPDTAFAINYIVLWYHAYYLFTGRHT